jgi:hypothetical protein
MPDSPLAASKKDGDVEALLGVMPRVERDITYEQAQAEAAGVPAEEFEEVVEGGQPVPGQIAQPAPLDDPEPEADEEGEEKAPQSALERVMTHIKAAKGKEAPEQSSNVEAELAKMQGRLDEQTRITEAALRGISQPATQEQRESQEVNYDDPEIQALLEEASRDPRKMGHAIKTIARLEGKSLYGKELEDLTQKLNQQVEDEKEAKQQAAVSDEMASGLQQAYALGGLEAEIIEQAYKFGARSLLFEHLQQNPTAALSAQGIVSAAMAVARTVERADAAIQQGGGAPATPAPTETDVVVQSSAPRGKSHNKRGNKALKPNAPSAATELKAKIMGAQSHAKTNLPFLKRT